MNMRTSIHVHMAENQTKKEKVLPMPLYPVCCVMLYHISLLPPPLSTFKHDIQTTFRQQVRYWLALRWHFMQIERFPCKFDFFSIGINFKFGMKLQSFSPPPEPPPPSTSLESFSGGGWKHGAALEMRGISLLNEDKGREFNAFSNACNSCLKSVFRKKAELS